MSEAAEQVKQKRFTVSLKNRGGINYRWVSANVGFFLFLALLAVLYIANGHLADRRIRNINATTKELKDLQYEYKTLKSEIMFRSRESEIIKAAVPLGMKIAATPPVHIVYENRATEKANQ